MQGRGLGGDGFLRAMLSHALEVRASDIHFQDGASQRGEAIVDFRIDGSMHRMQEYPTEVHRQLIGWVKAKLPGMAKAIGQLGLIPASVLGLPPSMHLRVAILGVGEGLQDLTIRILHAQIPLSFDKLGVPKSIADEILPIPYGAVLFSGPVGSGKRTAALSYLAEVSAKDARAWAFDLGLDESLLLPHSVRCLSPASEADGDLAKTLLEAADIDILYLGGISTEKKAQLLETFSRQGILTIGEIDAPSIAHALAHLLDYSPAILRWRIAEAVSGVLHQRLLRRLCDKCKSELEINLPDLISRLSLGNQSVEQQLMRRAEALGQSQQLKVWSRRGCKACGDSGFKGRLAVHEYLALNSRIQNELADAKSRVEVFDIVDHAPKHRMVIGAFESILNGRTSIEHVESHLLLT